MSQDANYQNNNTTYEQNSYNHDYSNSRINDHIIYMSYPKHKPVMYDSKTQLIILEDGWIFVADICGERMYFGLGHHPYPNHSPIPENNNDIPEGWNVIKDECGTRMYQIYTKPYLFVNLSMENQDNSTSCGFLQ